MRSGTSSSLWQSLLLQPDSASHRYPYPSRRHFMGHDCSLSQRLWDIDSGDDENEVEEDIVKVAGRVTPNQQGPFDFRFNHYENENNLLLHIDDNNDEQENSTYENQLTDVTINNKIWFCIFSFFAVTYFLN